jgi:hypothetical protein
MAEIAAFLAKLAERCPALRSIWLIGPRVNANLLDSSRSAIWDLVAFADMLTLQRLRNAADLHRDDVHFRVVIDGDRFETAWGALRNYGSLIQWGWQQTTASEAYYTEATWADPLHDANVQRTRRKAVRLWQSAGGDEAWPFAIKFPAASTKGV